jgi:chromosome segregation ATPase
VRQQQDNAKTCRLLALEVGSLKAELTREQKKRAQAVSRATAAEAAHRHAEQRLNELLYSNNKLQQELTAAKEAADSSSRRVHSLRQSLADAEAEAQEKRVLGQQQVGFPGTWWVWFVQFGQHQDRSMFRPHTTLRMYQHKAFL